MHAKKSWILFVSDAIDVFSDGEDDTVWVISFAVL
jgi:hypothetical protein